MGGRGNEEGRRRGVVCPGDTGNEEWKAGPGKELEWVVLVGGGGVGGFLFRYPKRAVLDRIEGRHPTARSFVITDQRSRQMRIFQW